VAGCNECSGQNKETGECLMPRWRELTPVRIHPARMTRKQLRALYEAACRELCDPLYLDMLKIKESL
jgi:hypothetical protein